MVTARGPQLRTIPMGDELEQITMNPESFDQLVTGRAVELIHYRALPSPINKNDKGEYRKSEGVDGISSSGFLFRKAGCFNGAILGNSKKNQRVQSGVIDYSVARLVIPRFYNLNGLADGDRIYLQPGDRIYIKDMIVEVARSELVQFNAAGDQLVYPALCVEHLIDYKNKEYVNGYDFKTGLDGNIEWIPGRSNPGVNADTGEGNVYTVRYRYNAHWYVANLINEVRVISITDEMGNRTPTRMAYSCEIQREYVYHDMVRDGTVDQKSVDPSLPSKIEKAVDPDIKLTTIEVEKSKFTF